MKPSRLSEVEQSYITAGVGANIRGDGRSRTEFRPLNISVTRTARDSTVIARAYGAVASATIRASVVERSQGGDVALHLHASHAVESQYALLLGGQAYSARAAFMAHAAAMFEAAYGATTNVADADVDDEATAVVRGSVLKSDLDIGGGFAYRLDVDVEMLQASGGGIIAAASYAVRAAFLTMRLPHVTLVEGNVMVDYNRFSSIVPRLHEVCVLIQLQVCDGMYVVDPTFEEEIAMPSTVIVGVTPSGHVCFWRFWTAPSRLGSTASPLPVADLQCLLSEAVHFGECAHRLVDDALESAEPRT